MDSSDSFQIKDKFFLILGVANNKSVAYHVANILKSSGAKIILSIQREEFREKVMKLFPSDPIYICDVEKEEQIQKLQTDLNNDGFTHASLAGVLHSIAYANLVPGRSFHQNSYQDLEQAARISCFSLIKVADAVKDILHPDASVVTISISSTRATAYGPLGPIKAMLDATVPFLAKSFSEFSNVRFNAVCAGPLKTSASAGIPNYLENYLFAEKLMLRKKALLTEEVAKVALFLLSPLSSGINAQGIVVDGGMSCNYFDQKIVKTVVDNL